MATATATVPVDGAGRSTLGLDEVRLRLRPVPTTPEACAWFSLRRLNQAPIGLLGPGKLPTEPAVDSRARRGPENASPQAEASVDPTTRGRV